MDAYLRIYHTVQLPALQAAPGFHEVRLLTDAITGKVMGVTLWETEADAKAAPTQSDKYGDLIIKPGVAEDYELSVRV